MTVRGDAISHSLLTTLYRYLSGYGDGLLKDPSIHRIVYNLMTKLFKRLIGQLRRLGTLIVYANFNRIILNTKKYDLAGAQEYVDFIVSALRTNDTFAYLEVIKFILTILIVEVLIYRHIHRLIQKNSGNSFYGLDPRIGVG